MNINKEDKLVYIGKVEDLIKASYSEIGTIYNIDIENFDALLVERKFKRVLEILDKIRAVINDDKYAQFNEVQVREYFKFDNSFNRYLDASQFQDFNIVNYFGIPTFDFISIINTIIYNDKIVKIDSYAEYLLSEEGDKLIASLKAQEEAKLATNVVPNNVFDNMTQEEINKFINMMNLAKTAEPHVTPNRYQSIDNAEVVGQSLVPNVVKPVGQWK
jgi:hypothetical protein|nr:MAG TPA: hypothetical protein [Caudoviricetes sp.]